MTYGIPCKLLQLLTGFPSAICYHIQAKSEHIVNLAHARGRTKTNLRLRARRFGEKETSLEFEEAY